MQENLKGKFVTVVGSSGSGKGTLIKHIQEKFPELVFPKSYVTRPMRVGENQGNPYNFLSLDEFKKCIEEGTFLEWAKFGGHYYATALESIIEPLKKGGVVLKELEVQGARILLEKLPRENLGIVFIDAGNWDEYAEARIKARAAISDDEIKARRERYEDEQTFKSEADFVVSNKNGELESAKKDFENIIHSIIS